jgi:egghead protein (zeste-white 4 protein)
VDTQAPPSRRAHQWPLHTGHRHHDAGRVSSAEPSRDWSVGVVTGHRVFVVLVLVVSVAALFAIQHLVWPHGRSPDAWYEQAWSWGSLIWLSALIPSLLGLLGMIWYRHPRDLDAVEPIPQLVSLRIVSRGENVEAVTATIRRCQKEMARNPLFPYVIEVITENDELQFPDPDIITLVIPPDYSTPNQSLYKARALQFALEHSTLPDDAWLVHLDEETQLTSSGVKGIARMIAEEVASGQLRIGQGAILYHRDWKRHPFLTLADNVRTGDDFARFHFQHRLGVTLFGLHGSYIVCRNDVEKSVGFDFGPVGSITEDAFWALKCMEDGQRARWVEGYLEEQSTQRVGDFIKQRRRWFQGLAKVSLHAPVKRRLRLMLGFNTFTWMLAPLGLLYTYAHWFWGFPVRGWVAWGANIAFASFVTLYLVGLKANLDEHGVTSRVKRAGWYAAQVILLPVFSAMESVGVAYALLRPHAGFHVVKK